jgi:hypothetical protein
LGRFLYGTQYQKDFSSTVKVDNTRYFTQIVVDDWQPGDNITVCDSPERLINTTRNKVAQASHTALELKCDGTTLLWVGNTAIMFMDDLIKHENQHKHDGVENPYVYSLKRLLGNWFTVCGDYGELVYKDIVKNDAKDISIQVGMVLGTQSRTHFDTVERNESGKNPYLPVTAEKGALDDYKKVKDHWAAKYAEYEQWRNNQYQEEAAWREQHPVESFLGNLDYRWVALGVVVFCIWSYRRKRKTSVKAKA